MEVQVLVAIITPSLSIVGSVCLFYFTKQAERKAKWRDLKIEHYRTLLSSLSELGFDGVSKRDADKRFSLAVNTIGLVAPPDVVAALMELIDEINYNNKNRNKHREEEIISKLVDAIRKDIGLGSQRGHSDFRFRMIGINPNAKD